MAADAYDRYMGRYLLPLPTTGGLRGSAIGPTGARRRLRSGALTTESVARVGPSAVAAVDPSALFVAAARERHPGVEIVQASAEQLPFPALAFDAAVAQLVVHFMPDPNKGLVEMARVTRRGGVVAACVWDHAGGLGPLSLFWRPARELDPEVDDDLSFRVSERVTWRNCSRRRGWTRSRRRSCGSALSTRPSKPGGSPSRRASAPREPTWRASAPTGRSSCVKPAEPWSQRHHSWSRLGPDSSRPIVGSFSDVTDQGRPNRSSWPHDVDTYDDFVLPIERQRVPRNPCATDVSKPPSSQR